jgi:uncharacterized protein (TIGR03066 family)
VKSLLALAACLVFCSFVQADEKKDAEKATKDKLVGMWVATKGDIPEGATLEFSKEGKLKLVVTVDGKATANDATFEADGDTLTVAHKASDGKDVKEKVKIKKLTDKELVMEDEKGKVMEFARK